MRNKKAKRNIIIYRVKSSPVETSSEPPDIIKEANKIINRQKKTFILVQKPQSSFKRKLKVFLRALWFII